MKIFGWSSRSDTAPPAARVVPPVTRPAPEPATRAGASLVRRSYGAAVPDRLAAGFSLFPETVRAEHGRDMRGLVGHSRHASQNFDLQRSYEMLFRRHVIGPSGIRLQMDVRELDGRRDNLANRLIEDAWERWGRMGSPTVCGTLSFWGFECQIATGIAREGGSLVRFHSGPAFGPFGFQVEAIPLDLLDIDLTTPTSSGGFVENGFEFDASGRFLAFHIWSCAPSDGMRRTTRRRLRIPADQMGYVLIPETAGQTLGVPRTATALRLMNMSEKYQKSAMAAANYGAAQMVFFEQEDDSGALPGAGRSTDVPIDEIEAGTMALLPPGVKAVPHIPHYPDAAVEPFMRHMSNSISAGSGVAAETLTGDLSRANFSALRAGKGEERDEWRMLQRAVYEGLHGKVFERWLPRAMLTGQIPLPMVKLEKFLSPLWRPRGWPSVNPKDDANANAKDLENGLRSRTEIAADRGRDFADVVAELRDEEDMMRAAGVFPVAPVDPAKVPGGKSKDTLK